MIKWSIRIRHHQYDSRNIVFFSWLNNYHSVYFQRNLRHRILEVLIDGYVNLKTKKKTTKRKNDWSKFIFTISC